MADNSSLPVASGNETFANNDIGGVKYPRQKVTWGPAGTANDTDVATGKPLPVQMRSATGLIPIGEPTDAKSTATDTTSASAISIWKQISASVQALNTAIGSTLWDLGIGTGGSRTQRVAIDTASQLASVADNADAVAASASLLNNPVVSKLMGWNGTTYDRLQVDANKYLKITNQPSATDGFAAPFVSLDLDETEELVKTGAGCLYKIRCTNRTTSIRYVKLYDGVLAGVTVGTTTPIDVIPVPAGGSADLATVVTESFGGLGLPFTTGLCLAATTGFANSDVGAPGANDVIVSAYYK